MIQYRNPSNSIERQVFTDNTPKTTGRGDWTDGMATNGGRQVQVRRHNPVEHSERVIDNLQDRGHALDADAAT
jgi:predicted 2-oxoglutarate/Fe(II)-dependent dioxygenase YbiX